ncbi:MAG: histidinol-phosphate transaminase [Methylacidiphilales bacterium]|nr:histidinol-phosphate transaminase [Candidatus Methylacidiphilales bacterium]
MPIWELANSNLKSLVPYEPGKPIDDVARELGLNPSDIIKLASNENPLGPSPKAREAMLQAAGKMHIYPDGGSFHLRNAIAERLGIDRSQIILGNGSNEIIEFVYHAFTRRNETSAVASRYAFAVYKLMAELFGVEFIEAPDLNLHHDLDAIRKAIRPDTRLVFLANPNNPTGTRIPDKDLENFLRSLPKTTVAVLDEAYYEFLDNPPPTLDWVREGLNLVVLRTFSKIQGLAGLRIGYGISTPEITEVLQRCRQPFNINGMAQAGALAALRDTDHEKKTKALIFAGRRRLENFARESGLRYEPSFANFVLIEVGDGHAVFQSLLKRGVIVRSMKSYGLPAWIRVSIGTESEMEKFERELRQVLANAPVHA